VTAELKIYFEDLVFIKTLQRERHKSNIHGRTAIAAPLLTESNVEMHKQWCHDHKIWTSDNWKRARDIVR
jgi:hypothetical protein